MYAGIDLGGTKIAAGLVDETGLITKITLPTDATRDGQKVIDDMIEAYNIVLNKAGVSAEDVLSIGIGIPGAVDSKAGVAVYANNLPFSNTPITKSVSEATGKPAFAANDADCAGLGEVMMGAAKGCESAFMITLGTGIGGSVIINGDIYSGSNGLTGEIGHMVIIKDGIKCTCGRKGCFESYVALRGLISLTNEVMAEHRESIMWQAGEVSARTAFDASRRGDKAATEVVERYVDYLACGVANIINALQPEALIIGGGIGNEGEYLVEKLRKRTLEEVYTPSMCKTRIISAALGNDAGLIGAAMLGKKRQV